jgi:chemotaxis signal transduction protein
VTVDIPDTTIRSSPMTSATANSSDMLGINFGNDGDAYTVFTFWSGDLWFAANVDNILSVSQDLDDLQPTPFKLKGAIGTIRYQTKPVLICDFSQMLGICGGREIREGLIETLTAREQDHVDWLNALEDSLNNDVPFSKARDPHQCAFGKWYDNFKTRDAELMDILARFDAPHNAIHALADELLSLKSTGQLNTAVEKLQYARNNTLANLRKHFAYARDQISSSIRPVVLYLTTDGSTPMIGLMIDEINDVISFSKNEMNGLDSLSFADAIDCQEIFDGYLSKDGERDCLLINPNKIYASIKNP